MSSYSIRVDDLLTTVEDLGRRIVDASRAEDPEELMEFSRSTSSTGLSVVSIGDSSAS